MKTLPPGSIQWVVTFCIALNLFSLHSNAQAPDSETPFEEWSLRSASRFQFEDPFDTEGSQVAVSDPIEPINRKLYQFNDRVYYWLLTPTAKSYSRVLPEPTRVSIRMFFENVRAPVRAANCLFQGKLKGAGREASRFVINSTIGIGGLFDPAGYWRIEGQDEDFDQTLGYHGVPAGPYIHWPIFGPSSVRGTIGRVGDAFLNPLFLVGIPPPVSLGIAVHERVNSTSLSLGDYERLTDSALDPYLSIRNAYFQNREKRIQD